MTIGQSTSGNEPVYEEVGGQVTGTGGKGVIAGQEGVAECGGEVTGTGEKVRGHPVDRKRMAMNGFEEDGNVAGWRDREGRM